MTSSITNVPDMSSPHRKPSKVRSRASSLYIGHVQTHRPVYTQEKFDAGHGLMGAQEMTVTEYIQRQLQGCTCSLKCVKKTIFGFLPFLAVLSHYSLRHDLVKDVIAGLTVGVMHIPQGMAYGLLCGLPPIYGLYVSFLPPLVYFFFGTSKHLSIGTFAVVSLMIGTVVEREPCDEYIRSDGNHTALFETDLQCRLGIATAVTFLAALMQIGMGLLHMGFVTIYLSEPLTRGLTTGAAVHVLTSQIKFILGIKSESFGGPLKLIYTYVALFKVIAETNWATVILAVLSMIILIITKEFINPKVKAKIHAPVPIELIIVILATVVSFVLGKLGNTYGIAVVGKIPTGIPAPAVPPMWMLPNLVSDAFSVAIVTFAINVSLAKLFSKKHGYSMDSNQELIAYGISNVAGSFFSCFMAAASLSRSLVQDGVGGQTQVTSVVSSGLLLVVLFAIGPLFETLPKCALAAIIIVNLKGMFVQICDLKKLWYISKYDFAVWLVIFLSVVLLDVDMGLLVGFIFCLLTVVFRTQNFLCFPAVTMLQNPASFRDTFKPYTCLLGRVPHTDIYNDLSVYEATKEVSGIKIFRFEAPLYFANADHFAKKLFKKTGLNAMVLKAEAEAREKRNGLNTKIDNDGTVVSMDSRGEEQNGRLADTHTDVHNIIIDCSTMGYIDWTGMNMFSQVIVNYKQAGIKVYITGCKWNIRRMLQKAGFFDKVDPGCMYVSVHDAVLAVVSGDGQPSSKRPSFSSQHLPLEPDIRWTEGDLVDQSGSATRNANEHSNSQRDLTSVEQDADTRL